MPDRTPSEATPRGGSAAAPAAWVVMLVGAGALIGWQLNVAALKSVLPGLVAMNPATAVAFVLAGMSLMSLRDPAAPLRVRRAGYLLAAAVAAIGLLRLCDLLLGSRVCPDTYLFASQLSSAQGLPPNRMAPNTATGFMLVGLALITLNWEIRRGHRPSQAFALLAAGLSLLAVLGYLLDVRQLYGVGSFIPMALNTAILFLVCSVGVLFARPARGITRVIVASDAGGTLARRLLPFALVTPVVLAWLRIYAQRAGVLASEPGVSVMVFLGIVILTGFIWWNASRLSHADIERRDALAELTRAHDDLELRVSERTSQLEDLNRRMRGEVGEHVQTANALRASEARYRLLFTSNPHPMWVYDRVTLRFMAVNDAAIRLYGYSMDEFRDMTIEDILPAEQVPALLPEIRGSRPALNRSGEWKHRRKDGTVLDVEVSSHTLVFADRDAALVLALDVTSRRQLEAQLRQAQKMEAVGQLAGGVAHDFNNLLTAIMGYGQLIQVRLAPDDPAIHDSGEILKAAERAASLTRQLLAFSRRQLLEPRVLDLNAVITGLDKMLRRLIGEDIDLVTAPTSELGMVRADPGQIEQVLMNLVVNARDAMPHGGRLTIETANVTLGEDYARAHVDVKPGRHVMLAVSDTGVGMSPETRARIFEPFFTTKETGKGTGLGLSTVHGIVRQSEGHIEVYTEPGHGTTFKICLPRVEGAVEPADARQDALERVAGTETILVVEDEESIRGVIRASLEVYGYRVLEAADGSEGITICERREQRIDLLMADVVMPLMGGPELVRRIGMVRPDLPVLLISGYTDRALTHQGLRESETAFLQKPFTPEALARKVREILDAPLRDAA